MKLSGMNKTILSFLLGIKQLWDKQGVIFHLEFALNKAIIDEEVNMTSTINPNWQEFKFCQDLKPRYGDFDTLLHVNNLAFLEMGESARIDYYKEVGIWDGVMRPGGFGMVMASNKTDFINSINYGDPVRVCYKTAHIGNKSITFAFIIKNPETNLIYARGEVVGVCFDHVAGKSVRVPQEWRQKLSEYENNKDLL